MFVLIGRTTLCECSEPIGELKRLANAKSKQLSKAGIHWCMYVSGFFSRRRCLLTVVSVCSLKVSVLLSVVSFYLLYLKK